MTMNLKDFFEAINALISSSACNDKRLDFFDSMDPPEIEVTPVGEVCHYTLTKFVDAPKVPGERFARPLGQKVYKFTITVQEEYIPFEE